MFYSFFIIPFLIIIHYFLIHISNANPSVDDKMLIAFIKGQQEIQFSDYSMQKYEAHLGIMHFMRMNWQCEKIAEEFEEYERTECQKYRKYLDILYEYLYREYAGIPTVKPKFVLKRNDFEIEGPLIYAVHCLVRISQFYFDLWANGHYKYKLNKLFNVLYKPNLLNEKRLTYGEKFENQPKMPINEMILQLAIVDTANESQINENLYGIIKQKFEENFEEMYKNAKENSPWEANKISDDKHLLILFTKFDDSNTWFDDAYISQLVKVPQKDYLNHELGAAYFMRKNWHCDKIPREFEEECQKNRKYLHLLYEYLFRIYVEGKNADLVNKLPAVKPIFVNNFEERICLDEVIKMLNDFSKCESFSELDEDFYIYLLNEEELNYEIKEEKNWKNKIIQKAMGKFNGRKNVKKGKQILNELSEIEKIFRNEFDQKMEKFL